MFILENVVKNTIEALNRILTQMELTAEEKEKENACALSSTKYADYILRAETNEKDMVKTIPIADNNPVKLARISDRILSILLMYSAHNVDVITTKTIGNPPTLYFLFFENLFRLVILDKLMILDTVKCYLLVNKERYKWDYCYGTLISVFISWYHNNFVKTYQEAVHFIARMDHFQNTDCIDKISNFHLNMEESYDRARQFMYSLLNIQNYFSDNDIFSSATNMDETISKIINEIDESVVLLWKACQNQSVITVEDTVKEEKTD